MFTDEELEEMAVLAIYNYFGNVKKMLTMKVAGVSSVSQGSQSISFENGVEVFTLTSDVLALLPKKKTFKVW